MHVQPERILLIRSGRHLGVALDVLKRSCSECRITVLVTPGAVRPDHRIERCVTYDARPRFEPMALLRNGLAASLWRQRFDRVAVLWPDPAGTGQSNVDRTALLVAPRGFDAITPDGTVVTRNTTALVAREVSRAAYSCGLLAILGLLLYVPAALTGGLRNRS